MSTSPIKSPKKENATMPVQSLDLIEMGSSKSEDVVPFNKVTPKKEMSRAEKEKMFIVKKIEERLINLLPEARYDQTKGCCGIFAFLFLVAGTVMCLKALSLTVLFASDPYDPTLLMAGACMGLPCMIWFVYIFIWPHLCCAHCRKIKANRAFVHAQRKERRDPGLFNSMVAAANKFSEPPIIRTRLFAMFRKKEYTIVCHTMQEFQEIFHFKTGVEPSRQLLKLRNPDGSSYVFEFKPEEFILDLEKRGIVKDTLFWVYCKGGFELDVAKGDDYRMRPVRSTDKDVNAVLKDGVAKYNRGPVQKGEVDVELDMLLAAEQEREERQAEEQKEAELQEQAEEERLAWERQEYEENGGFLGYWLPYFFKKRRKTPEELEREDPHDDTYRKELARHKVALWEKLHPPPPEPEEAPVVKFGGFGPGAMLQKRP